jgi:hypothetical protein
MHNVAFGNFGKDERIYVAFRSLPQGVSGTNCRSGLTPPACARGGRRACPLRRAQRGESRPSGNSPSRKKKNGASSSGHLQIHRRGVQW